MTFDEFFGDFNERQYAASIARLDEPQLRAEHDKVRKKVLAAQSTIAAGGLSVLHTAGFGLIGAGIGWRKQNYNSKKQSICEAQMARKGWTPEDMRKRDFLMAVGPSAAVSILVPGADHLAGHLINHAAGHGAAQFTTQHAADTLASAAHHPDQFIRAVSDGVGSQMYAVGQGLVGHATNLVPIDAVAQNTPQFLGNIAGQGLANATEMVGVHAATRAAVDKGANAVQSRMAKRSSESSLVKKSWLIRAPTSRADALGTTQSPAIRSGILNSSNVPTRPGLSKSHFSTPRTNARDSMPTASTSLPLADASKFLFFLIGPAINDIFGLPALWTLTLLANMYSLLTNNRSRFSWTWMYLSWPTLIASIFAHDSQIIWGVMAAWQFITALRLFRTHILRPGVLMCISLSLCICTTGELQEFFMGCSGLCFVLAMAQYNFTSESFERGSEDFVEWYDLQRSEIISFWICVLMVNESEVDAACYVFPAASPDFAPFGAKHTAALAAALEQERITSEQEEVDRG